MNSSKEPRKTHVRTQVSIAANPSQVFIYLTNLRLHRLWNPHLLKVAPMGKLKEGMEYKTESLVFGVKVEASNNVTKLTANKKLELENHTGMIEYYIDYSLRKQGDGTLVVCSVTVSAISNAFAFSRAVLVPLAKRKVQADLQLLKTVVEQGIVA